VNAPPDVSEEFALEGVGVDRGAVDPNKRPVSSWTAVMNRGGDQFLTGPGLSQQQHARVRGGHALDLPKDSLQGGALADDVAKGEGLPHLVSQVVSLQFDLLSKSSELLEGAGIGEGDRGLIRKGSEPLKLIVRDPRATEHGQNPQHLTPEDERLTGERPDVFRPHPLRAQNVWVCREVPRDQHGRAAGADAAHLPNLQRYTAELSRETSPILARFPDRPSGTRQQVETPRLVWALLLRRARGADVTWSDQPDTGEGNL